MNKILLILVISKQHVFSQNIKCSDVKEVYIENKCCLDPGSDITTECDNLNLGKVTLGDTETNKLKIVDKLENPFKGCIDNEMCWGMEHFLSGEFKKRTKGVGNDPSPYGGTLSGQLYPYLTAYTYHHGNMTHIESDMSKKLRADNNGENPLYMVETRMLTAMTTVRMLNSRNNLKNNWVKLTDSMGDVLPILEPNHRNTQKIRKIANNNVTFLKYSDINAYGFLSIVQKNNLYCVQSKLPSGKTHDIDCTLSSYDTLDTVGPNSGVLEFVDFTKVNSKVNIGDLSIGSNVVQDATCGIGKDPYVTDGSDILSKQTEENYLDDPSFGFTVAVPIGNEASYYLSGIGDGNTFFYQVVQFKISSQKTAPTFRDSQNGRTGNGPTVVTPGTQLDFPKRYVGMALYRHFYISTITSIELESSGRVGINALFGAETSGSSDVNYLKALSETPLMYEPGTKYSEPIPGTVLSQVAISVMEDSWSDTSFPKNSAGKLDYKTFNFGINAKKLSNSLESIYNKYILKPAGIKQNEIIVRTKSNTDPIIKRMVPAFNPDFANYLNEANGVQVFNQLVSGDKPLPIPPSDRVHDVVELFEPIYNALKPFMQSFYESQGIKNAKELAENPDARFAPIAFRDVIQLSFLSQYYKPSSPYFWTLQTNAEHTGENMYMSAEATHTLMNMLVNLGKTSSGKRVLSCSEVGSLFDPLDTTPEEFNDVSTYRDPPSEQSDGKVSTTLGGFTAYNPDYKTYRNTLTGGSGTVFYENHQGASAVASFDGQFSEVFFTSTGGFGPLWRFESVWQGATYMREKFSLEYYLGRLCMQH